MCWIGHKWNHSLTESLQQKCIGGNAGPCIKLYRHGLQVHLQPYFIVILCCHTRPSGHSLNKHQWKLTPLLQQMCSKRSRVQYSPVMVFAIQALVSVRVLPYTNFYFADSNKTQIDIDVQNSCSFSSYEKSVILMVNSFPIIY